MHTPRQWPLIRDEQSRGQPFVHEQAWVWNVVTAYGAAEASQAGKEVSLCGDEARRNNGKSASQAQEALFQSGYGTFHERRRLVRIGRWTLSRRSQGDFPWLKTQAKVVWCFRFRRRPPHHSRRRMWVKPGTYPAHGRRYSVSDFFGAAANFWWRRKRPWIRKTSCSS